jgi:hypothetical protein
MPTRDSEELLPVAEAQKGILVCLFLYVVFSIGLTGLLTIELRVGAMVLTALLVLDVLAGMVFVFLLAVRVYSKWLGVILEVLTLVPLIGVFALLTVNSKATSVLRDHGFRVGLLGADLRVMRAAAEPEP